MGVDLIFLVWLGLCGLVYIPTGALLFWWSHTKPIRNRSPYMVSIIHWSNFFETCVFLITLYLYFHGIHHNLTLEIIFQTLQTLLHCSFIIPYLLRCYRIYFVFHLEKGWDENDSKFRKNIHKASQKWLFKIYCTSMIPVIIFASFNFIIPGFHGYFPTSYYERNATENSITEMAYLFILFVEELAFVFFVYKLKDVNDDYKMTREVTIVCLLWTLNGIVSTIPSKTIWMIEGTIRNNLIMLLSSLYPVLLAAKGDSFEDVITLEVLESLELILQNELTLNAFEKALAKEIPKLTKIQSAPEYLQIWLKCEYYQNYPSDELEKEIVLTAKALSRVQANDVENIEYEVYKVLSQILFPLFKKTKTYQNLLKNVVHQQIYTNRILQTSFTLESDFEYSIMSHSFDLLASPSVYSPSPSIISRNPSALL
ncbi:unnamed protein product [Blepharisma stoltei]|uniref:RGS domain-containing protein n=1 Tax=Blepharisma stoltei TaxID=1481888 RepID=A0AAU9J6A6_9CILI|nr:unnamed protein product [Blepharisma stoltei]